MFKLRVQQSKDKFLWLTKFNVFNNTPMVRFGKEEDAMLFETAELAKADVIKYKLARPELIEAIEVE